MGAPAAARAAELKVHVAKPASRSDFQDPLPAPRGHAEVSAWPCLPVAIVEDRGVCSACPGSNFRVSPEIDCRFCALRIVGSLEATAGLVFCVVFFPLVSFRGGFIRGPWSSQHM